MTPSTELFELIKSMSRTEKRYFKINAASLSGRDNSVYLRLFDAIDQQEQYDETALKRQFKDEKFVKQFAVVKNYLQQIIIKSLTAYHATASVNIQINELLRAIEVMYEKGHYSICLKLIKKGKELAAQYEKYAYLDRLLEWESRIFFGYSQFQKTAQLLNKQQENVARLQHELQTKKIALEMYIKTTEFGFVATPQQLQELDGIVKQLQEKSRAASEGIMEKYYHYFIWHMYYCCTDDYAKRFEFSEKILSLLESNSYIIEENPNIYIAALNNYGNSLLAFGDLKKAIRVALKMRRLPELYNISRWGGEKNTALLLSYDIEIVASIYLGETEKAELLEKEIRDFFKIQGSFIQRNNLFELCYNLAVLYFLGRNFEKSLQWLYYIINARDLSHREDLYIASRLFNLLVHYELNNWQLLRNLVMSLHRFLKSKKRLFAPEIALFHFLKSYSEQNYIGSEKAAFARLLEEIEKYPEESAERKMANIVFLVPWIQSKLLQKPMKTIIKAEYKRTTSENIQKLQKRGA